MNEKSLKKKIREIPQDGWWISENEIVFYEHAKDLISHGYTEDQAVELLFDIYYCVGKEFGN